VKSGFALIAFTAALASTTAIYAAPNGRGILQMVSIDVEGGGGTLFVTPEGHSLLIDAGNPEASRLTGDHSSSERIAAAAQKLGLKKIDYLIITHYHVDHVGGLENLLARIPIGTFIDHGENREVVGTQIAGGGVIGKVGHLVPPPDDAAGSGQGSATTPNAVPRKNTADYYADYLKLVGNHPHIVATPGYALKIDDMNIRVIAADGKTIDKPLPGAGEPDPPCADMSEMPSNNGEENARSIASVITFGKVRIAAFGDLTWDREKDLFCPNDKVGKVDVYLASHHGSYWSGSPAMVNAMQPIVTIMGNSPTKGNDPERVKTIEISPRYQAMWQLHASRTDPQSNVAADMIANPDPDSAKDERYNLRVQITKDGSITVINERNGFQKTYQVGK
jgi:glyoxylase-like metal-dependent hydrolase (beta-lactamase superfamily II)